MATLILRLPLTSRKQDGADYNPWTAYSQSKTANILFATALADKLGSKGVLAFSLNPGRTSHPPFPQLPSSPPPLTPPSLVIFESKLMTNVSQDMFADGHRIATAALAASNATIPPPAMHPKSLAAGAATSIYAALDPELATHNGAFLVDAQVWPEGLMEHATGTDKADRLWGLSEKLVGEEFGY